MNTSIEGFSMATLLCRIQENNLNAVLELLLFLNFDRFEMYCNGSTCKCTLERGWGWIKENN